MEKQDDRREHFTRYQLTDESVADHEEHGITISGKLLRYPDSEKRMLKTEKDGVWEKKEGDSCKNPTVTTTAIIDLRQNS
mgnify:CR=1 FL=1